MVLYLHAVQHGHRAINFRRFQRIGLDIFAPHDDPGGLKKWEDRELFEANRRISQTDKELIRWQNAYGLFNLT